MKNVDFQFEQAKESLQMALKVASRYESLSASDLPNLEIVAAQAMQAAVFMNRVVGGLLIELEGGS